MWVGDGSWVDGRAHEDATWAGGGGDTELVSHTSWRVTADVPDGLPDRGRTRELTGRGLSGTSGNEDGDAGTFYSPACPGYCSHFGGGEPPPHMVPLMRHAGTLACSEREAPCHCPVRQGGGAEAKADGGGETAGDLGEGLLGLCCSFREYDGVQISGR